MTPLLGTKTPSALVGAKSGGDSRAARSLLSCALWSGIARLWRGMGGCPPPRRQHGLLGFHQPRDTQHGFPLPSGDFKESNLKPDQRVFTRHERRLFSPCMRKGHTVRNLRPARRARRPVTAFLRVVAMHGAAMARHGRPPSPAPATRPVRFSRNTKHGLYCRVITWFCLLVTIFSNHYGSSAPQFPGILRMPPELLSACRPAFSLDPAGNGWGLNWLRRYERVNG